MDFPRLSLDRLIAGKKQTEPRGLPKGFVAYPTALLQELTPEQISWQQQIFQKAYAEAQAALGFQKLVIGTLPHEARN